MKFLKFESEEAFKEAINDYMVDGAYPSYIGDSALDIIGAIFLPTGKMIKSESGEYAESAPIDGYHVNASNSIPELVDFEIEQPKNPYRIFAGYVP